MGNYTVRWSIEEFLSLYLDAVENGLTKEEFADSIGLKPLTVYQRVVKLRRDPRLKSLPHLKNDDRPSVIDRAAAVFAQFTAKAAARQRKSRRPAHQSKRKA